MRSWFETLKPSASPRWHLLAAALLWSVVGGSLLTAGVLWILRAQDRYAPLWIAAAVALGAVKARLVLDRAAGRVVGRILVRGDGRCLGGFLSMRTWLLVAVMAGGGRILRTGLLSDTVIGPAYAAVGAALLLGARGLWQAWHDHRLQPEPGPFKTDGGSH